MIKILNLNILLTLISLSALNLAIYVAVFYNTFQMEQLECFQLILLACHCNVMYMPCEWLNVK